MVCTVYSRAVSPYSVYELAPACPGRKQKYRDTKFNDCMCNFNKSFRNHFFFITFERHRRPNQCFKPDGDQVGLRRAKMLKRDALEHLPHKLLKNSLQTKRPPSQLEALPPKWRTQRGNSGQCRSSQPRARGGKIDTKDKECNNCLCVKSDFMKTSRMATMYPATSVAENSV